MTGIYRPFNKRGLCYVQCTVTNIKPMRDMLQGWQSSKISFMNKNQIKSNNLTATITCGQITDAGSATGAWDVNNILRPSIPWYLAISTPITVTECFRNDLWTTKVSRTIRTNKPLKKKEKKRIKKKKNKHIKYAKM